MANIFEIEKFLNDLLDINKFNDYCFNGIQIEGKHEVKKIAVGVSFNKQFLDEAIENNADMLLVHHGIFGKDFFKIRGYFKKRIEKVIKNNITLMGYHLPLDAHLIYGNNAQIAKKLNLNNIESYDIGVKGNFDEDIPFEKFKRMLEKIFNRRDLLIYQNKNYVKNVVIISGGASYAIESLEGVADTFITGEVKEHIRDIASEMGINYINAGHYATEIFGVKAISNLLKDKFNIENIFIDTYNEI
ncbi:dinuclear metal center protein, YbgI/SA1388 family [Marinitoga hydrogenitolerans DSM 16785]|uniref:Dinuclear metal center protein, YbgI/SA1388 family n=1 Tax=Marinitoga hydrogenitolerans (strain DSM 16785 / JCM 12826 / AT1271) TaxID=1122195 RepID=A0A1M4UY66_MARH1|nr:Nif3-like dinuclear metal center hexameric protein [Marinitoga hydrogenitolerans]SHE61701.1 dinuclear metal center protein, YbgI/SA1388 family [Marinitoga hydrogenitolerans DSM 16785]